jgi:hypothetical protein
MSVAAARLLGARLASARRLVGARLAACALVAVLAIGVLGAARPASAQGYFDQYELEAILQYDADNLDALPEVFYEYVTLTHPRSTNSVLARAMFYMTIGDGDVELGEKRAVLVELLNRRNLIDMAVGDTMAVPTTFGLDFRAYAPFPRYYPGARHFDKLFVIHKTVQAFAAYEHGQLARWGIVNTGDPASSPTPNGRYNFNWKEEERVSSDSPEDEEWEMFWVFNFHVQRGIHVHQYAMPTGGPTSHGCVRLVDADAEWVYHWADTWRTTVRGHGVGTSQGRLIEPGTTVLVLGTEPEGDPQPFAYKQRYPVLKRVDLPADPYSVAPGTRQQEVLDRKRAQQAATGR